MSFMVCDVRRRESVFSAVLLSWSMLCPASGLFPCPTRGEGAYLSWSEGSFTNVNQSHRNTVFRIVPCTPQLASTTWVTPKSAPTDISEIASSSLR